MRSSTIPMTLRRQLLPWAVTSLVGLVGTLVTFNVVLKWWNGMYTPAFAHSSDAPEALSWVLVFAAMFAAMATVGQSVGLVVAYRRWSDLSRWRLAAWSTVTMLATACVAALVSQGALTFALFDWPWVGVTVCTGIAFGITLAVASLVALHQRRRTTFVPVAESRPAVSAANALETGGPPSASTKPRD